MDADPERPGSLRKLSHDLKQPLNIMRLSSENIRLRICPVLAEDNLAYLEEKLDRIERQIDRVALIAETFNKDFNPEPRGPECTG